jgi:hypothetical protein
MLRLAGYFVFVFAGLASAAIAQNAASDSMKAAVGTWEISDAARERTCLVTLKADPAPGGGKLELDKACAAVLPMTKAVVAWSLKNEVLLLLDAKGQAVFSLSEVEGGMYEGERPGEGLFFLQSAASIGPPPRTADQMTGDWAVVRGGGRSICGLTLANTAAGGDTLTLRVKPGCDAFVTGFGPASWRMDRGELLLISAKGDTWRFEEEDPSSWRRVPESSSPILLVRR